MLLWFLIGIALLISAAAGYSERHRHTSVEDAVFVFFGLVLILGIVFLFAVNLFVHSDKTTEVQKAKVIGLDRSKKTFFVRGYEDGSPYYSFFAKDGENIKGETITEEEAGEVVIRLLPPNAKAKVVSIIVRENSITDSIISPVNMSFEEEKIEGKYFLYVPEGTMAGAILSPKEVLSEED